ncbi:MAG: O-antigen ligase family protein [Anaerolineales bacterium]|nr:O-antigen ligase family protein [Anaerolineales bacterium]
MSQAGSLGAWVPRPARHAMGLGLAVVAVAGLGVALGLGLTLPARDLIVSALVIVLFLILIAWSPYTGLLVWLVFYPFTETRINLPLGAAIPDLSLTRFVAAWLALLLFAQAVTDQRHFPRIRWLDVWGGLFVVGLGLSAVASSDPVRSITSVLDNAIVPLVFYFLAKNLVVKREEIERLFTAVLVVASYSAGLAIYEQLTGNILLAPGDYRLVEYARGIRILRSLWGSNAVFGSIFAFALPVGFYRLVRSQTGVGRLGYGLLLGVLLLAMFFTYKRASWISMGASFVILAAFTPAFRRVLLGLALVLAVPLALAWDRVAESSLIEQRVTSNYETLNGRTARWEAALRLWRDKPLQGLGFKSFDELSGFTAVENQYLHLLVSGGLITLAPFLLFLFVTFLDSVRLYVRGPSWTGVFVDRTLIVVFWAMASTYLVKGLTGVQDTPIHLIFFILIGAVIGSQGEQLDWHRHQQDRLAAGHV